RHSKTPFRFSNVPGTPSNPGSSASCVDVCWICSNSWRTPNRRKDSAWSGAVDADASFTTIKPSAEGPSRADRAPLPRVPDHFMKDILHEIGRASCRERVTYGGGERAVK